MSSENSKSIFSTIPQRNRAIDRIMDKIQSLDSFLIVGHQNPDEDCLASMTAMALLLTKFHKKVAILLKGDFPDSLGFLQAICRFNRIPLVPITGKPWETYDAFIILDTPKPEMIQWEDYPGFRASVTRIEIDHHLGADSQICGDPQYSLIAGASSTCELIGLLLFKLLKRKDLLQIHGIYELFSRNLVLAILTGILGDTKMGKYLKTKKEKLFYDWFSRGFDQMLTKKTRRDSHNFTTKEQVFEAMAQLSGGEEDCFKALFLKKIDQPGISAVLLDKTDSQKIFEDFPPEIVQTVVKILADRLAEESGALGLVAYLDPPQISNLWQFRLRRSQNYKNFDLRVLLEKLRVENGGGHPGAVGFRYSQEHVQDFNSFAENLIESIHRIMIPQGGPGDQLKSV